MSALAVGVALILFPVSACADSGALLRPGHRPWSALWVTRRGKSVLPWVLHQSPRSFRNLLVYSRGVVLEIELQVGDA